MCANMRTWAPVYACTHACMPAHTHRHAHTGTRVCKHVHACPCTRARVCAHVHIYMYWEGRKEFCAGTNYLLITPRVSHVLVFMIEAVHSPSKPGSCHTRRMPMGPVATSPCPVWQRHVCCSEALRLPMLRVPTSYAGDGPPRTDLLSQMTKVLFAHWSSCRKQMEFSRALDSSGDLG